MGENRRREIEDRVALKFSKRCQAERAIVNVQRDTTLRPEEKLIWGIILRAYSDAVSCFFAKKEIARCTLPPANLNELRQCFGGKEYVWAANAISLNLTGERMLKEAEQRANELEKECLREIEKEIEKENVNEEESL